MENALLQFYLDFWPVPDVALVMWEAERFLQVGEEEGVIVWRHTSAGLTRSVVSEGEIIECHVFGEANVH